MHITKYKQKTLIYIMKFDFKVFFKKTAEEHKYIIYTSNYIKGTTFRETKPRNFFIEFFANWPIFEFSRELIFANSWVKHKK